MAKLCHIVHSSGTKGDQGLNKTHGIPENEGLPQPLLILEVDRPGLPEQAEEQQQAGFRAGLWSG
jgi:hypothetical protein